MVAPTYGFLSSDRLSLPRLPFCDGPHNVHNLPTTPAFAALAGLNYSIASADRAICRSTNFWILPVDVRGNSRNTKLFGTLKCAMC